ncbi:RNA polymerase sigma factor [Pseudonocardia sp. CA-107938]|uniref:RNA polymerase sigma factor n=1 Tax=Pseudonocardia sp. CA-107938 TaxID=3240021 RepID=UPI003D8ACD44
MTDPVAAAVEAAFRDERGQVLATVIGLVGDWELAEDCVADAFAGALTAWRRDGVPDRPGAWLTVVARNRARDRLRRAGVEQRKLAEVAEMLPELEPEPLDDFPDERLKLIFTCCHPALAPEARVALTLRTLTALTTPEIARAFLVPEPTMAQRLVRAQRKIRNAGIPYRVPPAHLLPERTAGVLAVLYLLYREGYAASTGDLVRSEVSAEAIRLARALVALMPDEPEAVGLLALMLLQDARRPARLDGAGELVLLADQDRTRWDRALIEEGVALLDGALRRRRAGAYQLQAAIAAEHDRAPSASETDWAEIVRLYDELLRVLPSPVVRLNRAIAVGEADGPGVALPLVEELAGQLPRHHLLPATRADLLRRLGRTAEAEAAYREALGLAPTAAEQRFLEKRLAELGG